MYQKSLLTMISAQMGQRLCSGYDGDCVCNDHQRNISISYTDARRTFHQGDASSSGYWNWNFRSDFSHSYKFPMSLSHTLNLGCNEAKLPEQFLSTSHALLHPNIWDRCCHSWGPVSMAPREKPIMRILGNVLAIHYSRQTLSSPHTHMPSIRGGCFGR